MAAFVFERKSCKSKPKGIQICLCFMCRIMSRCKIIGLIFTYFIWNNPKSLNVFQTSCCIPRFTFAFPWYNKLRTTVNTSVLKSGKWIIWNSFSTGFRTSVNTSGPKSGKWIIWNSFSTDFKRSRKKGHCAARITLWAIRSGQKTVFNFRDIYQNLDRNLWKIL